MYLIMSSNLNNNKRNKKVSSRRKQRRDERLEKRLMDGLYEKALLDPQTTEGQIRIDADLLLLPSSSSSLLPDQTSEQTFEQNIGYVEYFSNWIRSYWGSK